MNFFHRWWVAAGLTLLAVKTSAAVHYVNLNGAHPTTPYLSWNTAATNIQAAVDAATNGDLILVTNGVYQAGGRPGADGTTNRVLVDKPVTLQSVNGSATTAIDGGNSLRCIYLTNGAVLTGFALTNGNAGNGAGAMCAGTNVWLANCLLVNNTASSAGGIYSGTLTNCTLSGNACPVTGANGGGALGSTLVDCRLSGNVTGTTFPNYSGGTSGGGAASCILSNCTLTANSAYGAGGSGGGAAGSILNNCTLSNNYADNDGGGVINCTLNHCTLSNNSASSGGGACEGTLNNCLLSGNQGGWGGGAYFNTTLNNCILTNNYATSGGGGASGCALNNCLLLRNLGGYGGGAYDSSLNNCLVYSNTANADGGGGVYLGSLNNCTLVGNYGWPDAGGEYGAGLNNCIIYDNTSSGNFYPNYQPVYNYGGALNYCCTTPLPTGTGNFTNAPMFVNEAGGDFHLQSGSPCVNTGNNAAASGVTDLDGIPRIIDDIVDIGAYEFPSPGYIVIQAQPQGRAAIAEQTVLLSVTAASPLALTYQWQLNATNLPLATNAALTIFNVQSNNAGIYAVLVSNAVKSVTSSNALLTVLYPPPVILTQPADLMMTAGSNAVFSCVATGYFALRFQWQWNGANLTNGGRIAGATNSTLTVSGAQPGDNGSYQVIVYDKYGNVVPGSAANLTVLAAPGIAAQPQDLAVTRFLNCTLSVTATGAPALFYQWQKNGTNLANTGNVSGADTPNLTLSNPMAADSGPYDVIVSNAFGSVTSSNATLTVVPLYLWGNIGSPVLNAATNIVAVSAGGDGYDLALRGDGAVVEWGSGNPVPPDATNIVAIAAGHYHGLALRDDGAVIGWGDNTYGQATPPAAASNALAIAAGHWHSLALAPDGTVIGWGDNSYGECTPPAGVSNVVAISAGGDFSLALKQDGTVVGWGENDSGQATPPPDATNIVAIAAGEEHAVALRRDGTVLGWGATAYGYDVVPAGATNMVAIAAGNEFSAALRPDGTMLNWGYNDFGEAGTPYFITNVVAISAKEYHNLVLIQDSTSQVAPRITRQPGDITPATGQNAILYPMATGSLPMNFQWYFNGNPLPGQTNTWLMLVAINTNQAGNYQLVVTNDYGAVTSRVAVISELPGIITPPASQAAFVGNSVTFTAGVDGIGPFGYQWYSNSTPLVDSPRVSGSATASLTLSNVQTADAGSYSLVVTNATGSTAASPALLDAASQPTNQLVLAGNSVTFSTTVTGPVPVFYQWENNGILLANGGSLSGATNAGLSISGAQTSDSGAYQVIVMPTNSSVAATSSVASLTVLAGARITGQPASQAVLIGGTATFTAGVSGSDLGYQWFRNGVPLSDDGHFVGSTTPALTIFPVQPGDASGYVLFTSNALSSATSQTASLTPLTSLAPSVRYVNVNNASPAAPYLDWSTAARNIQDAIDAAVSGDNITVTDGVYQVGGRAANGLLTNRVVINKAVSVQSVNGAAATVIRGNLPAGINAVRCAYLTNGAVLTGFTLTGGATRTLATCSRDQSGGGAWCESTNARLIGCLIVSNVAWLYGGGECFGALTNCTLAGNATTNVSSTPGYGGGAYFGVLDHCLISNNLAGISGGGAYSNVLNHCTLAGNWATNRFQAITRGGGADLCTLNYCILSNNMSAWGPGGGAEYSLLNNCLVCYNHANSGGGTDGSRLNNCTVTRNSAGSEAGGGLGGVSSGSAQNCIIYYNGNGNSYLTYLTNCCISPVPFSPYGGPGNFTNAPLLVDTNIDFHLQSNSPCINSGNNPPATPATDLDGNPRLQGGTVDVGAYEYQTPSSLLSYAWAQRYGLPTDGSADFNDPDGDGASNWQEWRAGTNPTNRLSVLEMVSASPTNNPPGVVAAWQSVSGITYLLQRSTNLAVQPPFTTVQTNIAGQPGATRYTDTTATNGGPYFYRVGVP